MPEEVLAQAAREMLDWPDASGKRCGMGVMEMSHRGKEFMSICAHAEATLRSLLAVPAHFKVLFMQGGGLAENAIVPMNLSALRAQPGQRGQTDFVVTGSWSQTSLAEAGKYSDTHEAASAQSQLANWRAHASVAAARSGLDSNLAQIRSNWNAAAGN